MNSFKVNKKNRIILVVFILFLGVVWRIYDCYNHDMSVEEKFSLYAAEGSLYSTCEKTLSKFQPPIYSLLLNLWLRIKPTVEFARLLSVLFSILSLLFIFKIWKYLYGDEWQWVILAVYVFNSFHIWAASLTRFYVAVIFFSAASTYYFVRIMIPKQDQQLKWSQYFWYFLWSLIGVFSFYPFGFFLLGHFLSALFWFNRKKFFGFITCYSIIGIFLLLWFPRLKMLFFFNATFSSSYENTINPIISGTSFIKDFFMYMLPSYQLAKSVIFLPVSSLTGKIAIFVTFYCLLAIIITVRFFFCDKKLTHEEKIFATVVLTPLLCLFSLHIVGLSFVTVRYYVITCLISFLFVIMSYNVNKKILRRLLIGMIIFTFVISSILFEIEYSKSEGKLQSKRCQIEQSIHHSIKSPIHID